jgi:hypothetical protein
VKEGRKVEEGKWRKEGSEGRKEGSEGSERRKVKEGR